MESWEALDTDDSDLLPSLVQVQVQVQVRPSLSKTLLPCSKRPRHLSNNTDSQTQTLDSQSQQTQVEISQAPCTTSKPLTIPGPAGTIQSAMHRKTLRDQASKDDFPSTQEYLRRAIQEEGNAEDDDDFKQNPWICGLDFINRQRSSLSSLGSIKKCRNRFDRVPLLVAIVKSCTPNGLGDLIVMLKDPSGTIGANIHHKVVAETEFGKDISVGSVLVLHKVAVFSPSPSACYLNITANNVIKVIRKDSGPPPLNIYPASPVRVPASVTGMIKNPVSVRVGTAERITNEDVGRYTNRMLVDGGTQSSQHNPLAGSLQRAMDTRSSQHAFVDVEPLVGQEIALDPTVSKEAGRGPKNVVVNRESQAEGILPGSLNCGSSVSQHNSELGRIAGIAQKPQWTDAQLEELLAGCDDW